MKVYQITPGSAKHQPEDESQIDWQKLEQSHVQRELNRTRTGGQTSDKFNTILTEDRWTSKPWNVCVCV